MSLGVNAVDVQMVINAALGSNYRRIQCPIGMTGPAWMPFDVQLVINKALGL